MEVPKCPNLLHAGSRVVRDGWYGKAPHRRQRWRCTPTRGDRPHRFTPTLTRQVHSHAAPNGFCLECSTAIEPWEGQAGARTYLFAAREIGDALARVAQGASYRSAAETARVQAERVKDGRRRTRRRRRRIAARDGQIVANWVDVFAPVVCDGELPSRWPATLLIDSKAFQRGGATSSRFNVFGAAGVEDPPPGRWSAAPSLWRLAPYPAKGVAEWVEFFELLDGTPRVIVCDADAAIRAAIGLCFPRDGAPAPEVRLCEHHIKELLRDKLDVVLGDPQHPITRAFPLALTGVAQWQRFEQAVRHEHRHGQPLGLAVRYLDSNAAQIAAQVSTRGRGPNSTGPVEAQLNEIARRLHDRRGNFTNRARIEQLLALMTLDIRGQANGRVWADRIRERIHLAGGHARHIRPHDDPKGIKSLFT